MLTYIVEAVVFLIEMLTYYFLLVIIYPLAQSVKPLKGYDQYKWNQYLAKNLPLTLARPSSPFSTPIISVCSCFWGTHSERACRSSWHREGFGRGIHTPSRNRRLRQAHPGQKGHALHTPLPHQKGGRLCTMVQHRLRHVLHHYAGKLLRRRAGRGVSLHKGHGGQP